MIQELGQHTFDNQFYNKKPKNNDYLILVKNKAVLVKMEENQISFPKVREIENQELFYLFCLDDENYFSTLCDVELEGYKFVGVNEFRYLHPQHKAFAFITGYQIVSWYQNHRYCPVCGKKMHIDDVERKVVCDGGHFLYPQICPAVIVGIVNEYQLLLTQYINGKNYALVAGYNEVGETIEETVIREVKEETGLNVKNLNYYKSQPWGLTSTILFGFYCEVDGDTKIIREKDELQEAKWVKQEDIPIGYVTSLTAEMMQTFKEEGRAVLLKRYKNY